MDESNQDSGAPVIVFRCSGDAEAGVVRALLESYGIPCSLSSDITHIAYPLTVDGLGEVRVSVPASAADEAREIIEAHERAGRLSLVGSEEADEEASRASGAGADAEEDAGGGGAAASGEGPRH